MKVLYIAGAGRSGSTLLEMILGNLPGFFSVGEMRYFWEYINRADIACGCGEELAACSFWRSIKRDLAITGVDLTRLAKISERLNHTRYLPSLLLNPSPEWNVLREGFRSLYVKTGELSKAKVLVDASKVPAQLLLLREISELDVRVLHLVRDGRAVAYSWNKRQKREPAVIGKVSYMPQHSLSRAMLTWVVENIFVLYLSRTLPHVVMRYEDFTSNPKGELSQAIQKLGLSDVDLGLLDNAKVSLEPTHSVGGNPIRFSEKENSITAHNHWQTQMPGAVKLLLGLLGMPVLLHFGYRLY